jgi:3-deoxy-D-manno-octulosonate 8-phosphate phosphatase (KDO 8-P phosphatase)
MEGGGCVNKKDLAARARGIKIVLMDVDGVLTDGKMYYIPGRDGRMVEFKAFHALDGIGLRLLNNFGIRTGVITGRESPGTEERAAQLGMTYAYLGFLSKLVPMEEILAAEGLTPRELAYIGDDWTDIPLLRRAGLACAPANALPEVKAASHFTARKEGGLGAVREVCDLILSAQGRMGEIMKCVETAHWPSPARPPMKIVRYSERKKADARAGRKSLRRGGKAR